MHKLVASSLASILVASQAFAPVFVSAQDDRSTATPIHHIVVIFQENVSFDHYFGTYPNALNPKGEPRFTAAPGTPSLNGFTEGLLTSNPNFLNTALNGTDAANPFRLDRSQASTADQDHNYTPEQEAFHGGLMDGFPKYTGTPGPPPTGQPTNGLVMGYYDGNTVTAYWNYAQNYSEKSVVFAPPSTLRSIPRTPETQAIRTRRLTLDEKMDKVQQSMGMLLNKTPWHAPVTETPVLDTTEIWEIVNLTEDTHPIHLHLVRFRLLDRRPFDDFLYMDKGEMRYIGPARLPEPEEAGWKDTVRCESGEVTRIIVKFEGYTGRYVWHCHILEHEDNEMMRPYEVVAAT